MKLESDFSSSLSDIFAGKNVVTLLFKKVPRDFAGVSFGGFFVTPDLGGKKMNATVFRRCVSVSRCKKTEKETKKGKCEKKNKQKQNQKQKKGIVPRRFSSTKK